jgi:hypothetical protein
MVVTGNQPTSAFLCPKCKKEHISKKPNDKAHRHWLRIESGLYAKYEVKLKKLKKTVELVTRVTGKKQAQPEEPKATQPESYKEDPFERTKDGHVVDLVETNPDKRFVVPKNFDEFSERYPNYIRRWVMKHTKKMSLDADVEDWEADLAFHMRYLPVASVHRVPGANGLNDGCIDRIQTFDPVRMHGATPARFFHFVNNLLRNCFITEISKRKRQPLHIPNNLSYGYVDEDSVGVVDDEYLHKNSPLLTRISEIRSGNEQTKLFVEEFYTFVQQKDPKVIPILDALRETGTHVQARKHLQIDKKLYNRQRKRIQQLSRAFLTLVNTPRVKEVYA